MQGLATGKHSAAGCGSSSSSSSAPVTVSEVELGVLGGDGGTGRWTRENMLHLRGDDEAVERDISAG